jgi:hypothetical protein
MTLENPTFLYRHPWATVLGVVLAFFGLLGLAYWLGMQHARAQADSKYLQDREASAKIIAEYEAKEKELEATNTALKQENEIQAKVLKENDAQLKGDADKFTKLLEEERNERIKNIDNTSPDDQLCGLCADARASGFPLSDATCSRCDSTPQASGRP